MTEDTQELVPVFGSNVAIADDEELLRGLEDTQDEGSNNTGISFMSFSGKKGVYKIGVDGREPGEEEHFLIDSAGFELGYMCWKGGKPVAKRMANTRLAKVSEPDYSEFGPFDERRGEGWSRARGISVRSFENGEQCHFTSSSKTGVSAMAALQKSVIEQIKGGLNPWPVVTFSMKEVPINGFDVPIPVMTVEAWLSREDISALSEPGLDPMSLVNKEPPKPAPKPKRRL